MSDHDRQKGLESNPSVGVAPEKPHQGSDPVFRRLPALKLLGEGLGAIAGNWNPLLKAIAGPAILLTAVSVEGDFSDYDSLRAAAGILTSPILMTLIAVCCHRLLILGIDSLPNRWGFFWTRRETRFLGWSIKVLIGWFLFAAGVFVLWDQLGGARILNSLRSLLALGQLPLIVMVAPFVLCSMYVGARLSLLLAATAVDQVSTPRKSWELSRRNGWRLVTIIFLPAILFLPVSLVASPALPDLASEIFSAFMGVMCGVVGIASLSKAFCWLSEDSAAQARSVAKAG